MYSFIHIVLIVKIVQNKIFLYPGPDPQMISIDNVILSNFEISSKYLRIFNAVLRQFTTEISPKIVTKSYFFEKLWPFIVRSHV